MLNASRVQRIEIFMEFSEFIITVRHVAGKKPKVKKFKLLFSFFLFLMTLEMILTSVNSSSICTLKHLRQILKIYKSHLFIGLLTS